MKISPSTILNLTDYLILNSYTLTSSGLYEGKAGHALCLFEMARFFQNEELDTNAFDLLEEALVSKTKNIDFGFGLSGIGYTLAYLIRHDFIEADFHDFFGQQQNAIFDQIKNEKEKWRFLSTTPFLLEYKQLISTDKNADSLIVEIINDSIRQAEVVFSTEHWHKETRKESWISFLKRLFRTLFVLQIEEVGQLYDVELLKEMTARLAVLIKTGRVGLSEETAFYKNQVIRLNTVTGPDKLTINASSSAILDLASLTRLSAIHVFSNQLISFEKNPIETWTDSNIEQMLNAQVGKQQKLCSLHQGIIRYLLYWIHQENPQKRLFSLLLL